MSNPDSRIPTLVVEGRQRDAQGYVGIVSGVTKIARVLVLLLLFAAAAPVHAQTTVASGVSDEATEANSQPKLARDSQGTIYLTFVKPVRGVAQIFVASSDDNGEAWRVQQITTEQADSRYPTLALGSDNQVHLAWTQYDGGVGKVYYSRFDGKRWTPAVRLSPGDAYAGLPALASTPDGALHIVWYGIRAQAPAIRTRHGSIYEILYRGRAGTDWTPAEVISPGIPDSINPALGVDGQGRLHSAWYQFDLRAYQVRHTERDKAWKIPKQISRGDSDAFAVAMAVGRDGAVYVVWERRAASGIRIHFAERHERWSGQQPLSADGKDAFNPSVAVDERGRLYVAWESEGQLYLRRRDRQWLGPERLSEQGQNNHPILSSNGKIVDLMWTQQIGGEHRVRFATIAGAVAPAPSSGTRLLGLVIITLIIAAALWQFRRRLQMT